MGKLIITDASDLGSEFALSQERTTIGRHANNDLVLNDKAVSGKHAVIVMLMGDAILEDLESTNGTRVNGERVTRYPLAPGDVISIGRNTLTYVSDTDEGQDFEQTMVLRTSPGSAPARPAADPAATPAITQAVAPAATSIAGKPLLGKLRVSSGSNAGKELELTKALTTIGKPGVQVAAITRRADGYYIVQVGGGSGDRRPIVNGVEIDAQARRLGHGDRIELAGTEMEFTILPG